MKVAILFSGGASVVPYLLNIDNCEIVGAISSSKSASGIAKLERLNVPVIVNDIHDFYRERDKPLIDMNIRKEWDRFLIQQLKEWGVDFVVCSGYMYLLTSEFVNSFNVINVHPADLRIKDENGNRKYIGYKAVLDAIETGERETRSTVHLMNEETDDGPLLVVSSSLPINSDLIEMISKDDISIKQVADIHQEYMKYYCDGPAFRMALTLLSRGRLEIKGNFVYLDGKELEDGFVMDRNNFHYY